MNDDNFCSIIEIGRWLLNILSDKMDCDCKNANSV